MAKRYLVTGGTGFLGRSIVKALIKEGNDVTVFDNDSRGSIDKLDIPQNKFKFIKGDIRDSEAVFKAAKNITRKLFRLTFKSCAPFAKRFYRSVTGNCCRQ